MKKNLLIDTIFLVKSFIFLTAASSGQLLFAVDSAGHSDPSAQSQQSHEQSDAEKVNSSTFNPKELISFFGIKDVMGKDELADFKHDMKELMAAADVLAADEPQSKGFYEKAIIFSKKYTLHFPVGSMSSEALDEVHITKESTRDLSYEMRMHAPDSSAYHNLYNLSKLLHVGAGYLSLKKGRNEDATTVMKMGMLMRIEYEVNPGICFSFIKQDAKKARIYKDFLDSNSKEIASIEGKYIAIDGSESELDTSFMKSVQKVRESISSGVEVDERGWDEFNKASSKFKSLIVDKKDLNPVNIYNCITRIWEVKGIAHSLQNKKMLGQTIELLEEIKNKSSYSLAKRWAAEALLVNKEKICKRYIFVKEWIASPNGEIQGYKDLDGKTHPYNPEDFEF